MYIVSKTNQNNEGNFYMVYNCTC